MPEFVPLTYVRRSSEGEPLTESIYRAITNPANTSLYHSPTEYIHLDWSEVMAVASDEWTPISASISRVAERKDIIHNWLEQRYAKNPTLSFVVEGTDPTNGLAVVPVRYQNVMSTQGVALEMTDESVIVANAGNLVAVGRDEFARQMNEKLLELIRQQELAILESHYHDSSEPRSFRGLLGNYRNADGTTAANNGWIGDSGVGVESTTTRDLGGIEVNAANLEGVLDNYLLQLRVLQGGGLPTDLYIPPRLMAMFKNAASAKIHINMTQEEVGRRVAFNMGGQIGKFLTAFGILNIIAHPSLEVRNAANDPRLAYSRMLAIDPNQLTLVDYANYGGFHMETRPKVTASERRIIKHIYTLRVRKLLSQGCIKNFWTAP